MRSRTVRSWIALAAGLAALAATACERSAPPPPPPEGGVPGAPVVAGASGRVVARYGGDGLTAEELVVELGRLPSRSRRTMNAEGRRKFVENYVLNELLFAEGDRQGLTADPEITRQVDELRKRLVVQRVVRNLQDLPPITDEQVTAYYEANPEKFSTATIKARHILFKDEAKAKEIRDQVKADPAKFAELAQANSADTASARKGGDLGFFGRGRMVPEFEAAAFALKAGEISEVVKTPYGYHVIQVEEIREGTRKPFDQAKEQIRATLRNQALQARTKEYYDDLKQRAGVTIDEAVLEEVVASMPQDEPAPVAARSAGALPAGHPGAGAPPGSDSLPAGHPPIGGAPGSHAP